MKIKNLIWYWLGNNLKISWPFHVFQYLKGGIHVTTKDTVICIEGFPRSGNTFLFSYFRLSIPDEHIAHHLHNCAQIELALKHGTPIVFSAREPINAISSYVVREGIPLKRAIKQYLTLYEFVRANKKGIMVVDFEALINQPEQVVYEIADKFNLRPLMQDVELAEVRKNVEVMDKANQKSELINPLTFGLPNNERNEAKKCVKAEMDSRYDALMTRCKQAYFEIL